MPHSILMMHHPSGASRGQASEMHIESRELVRVRDYLSLIISDSTGQPYDRVSCWRCCCCCFVKGTGGGGVESGRGVGWGGVGGGTAGSEGRVVRGGQGGGG
jgi:hypothetical protein